MALGLILGISGSRDSNKLFMVSAEPLAGRVALGMEAKSSFTRPSRSSLIRVTRYCWKRKSLRFKF